MPESAVATLTGRLRWRRDLGLLFDPRTGLFHRVRNATAHQMVALAYEGCTEEDIARRVAGRYGVAHSVVAGDLSLLLAQLNGAPGAPTSARSSVVEIDKRFDAPLRFPLRMEIELTAVCNWNCGFCYNVWKIDPTMSDAEVRRAVKTLPGKHIPTGTVKAMLDEFAASGCFVVRYSGGETLLHPDAMEIFEYGGRLGLYQVVFTNGHFVTPQVAAAMSAANVRCVLVSIHGDESTHNGLAGHHRAYALAVQAMDSLRGAGIDVVAELTLVAGNTGAVLDVIKDVYQHGVRQFGVMRYVPTGRNDDVFGVPIGVTMPLIEQIDALVARECPGMIVAWPCAQKICTSEADTPLHADDPTLGLRFSQLNGHCEAGMVWGSVSYDGRLRNCPHSNVYFGNVQQQPVGQLWPTLTAAVHDAVTTRPTCAGCAVTDICRGGCHLGSFFTAQGTTSLPMPSLGSRAADSTAQVTRPVGAPHGP
jgi:radical SAM protein with 4Fe4S-binding SPASM domain